MKRSSILWFLVVLTIGWVALMTRQVSHFDHGAGSQHSDCRYYSGKPILDVELSSSPACFADLIRQGDEVKNAEVVRTNTFMDFGFIALYWAMLMVFASLQPKPWSATAMLLITTAALFDLAENSRIFDGLNHLGSLTPDWTTPRPFSLVKWLAFALAMVALAIPMRTTHKFLSLVFLAAAILTGLGIYCPLLMQLATLCFLLALLGVLVEYFPWRRFPNRDAAGAGHA